MAEAAFTKLRSRRELKFDNNSIEEVEVKTFENNIEIMCILILT